tara:strand:- start:10055 stop:10318 length:264 start_codon:yes stop_codon:yes gene_type:complete
MDAWGLNLFVLDQISLHGRSLIAEIRAKATYPNLKGPAISPKIAANLPILIILKIQDQTRFTVVCILIYGSVQAFNQQSHHSLSQLH